MRNDAGQAVDIQGVHDGEWAKTRYSDAAPGRIAEIGRAEAAGADEGYRQWAEAIVARHGDRFGIGSRALAGPR